MKLIKEDWELKKRVKSFWNEHPLCSYEIKHKVGTKEFFNEHDKIRRIIETYSRNFCEYDKHNKEKGLDVGCGIGWVVCEYAKNGATMTGIDITGKAVNLSRKRLNLLGLKANIFQGDAENIQFNNDSFDFVTSFGVLHHTPNTQKAIDEIYRVLKPGGKAILSLYYKNILLNKYFFPIMVRILKLIGVKMHGVNKLENVSLQQFVNWYDGKDNPLGKIYSKQEIKKMFNKFNNLELEVHYFPKRFLSFGDKIPEPIVKIFDRYFGFMIFIRGHKPRRC